MCLKICVKMFVLETLLPKEALGEFLEGIHKFPRLLNGFAL